MAYVLCTSWHAWFFQLDFWCNQQSSSLVSSNKVFSTLWARFLYDTNAFFLLVSQLSTSAFAMDFLFRLHIAEWNAFYASRLIFGSALLRVNPATNFVVPIVNLVLRSTHLRLGISFSFILEKISNVSSLVIIGLSKVGSQLPHHFSQRRTWWTIFGIR